MTDLPGRFITQGSPTLRLDPCPARGFMARPGDGLPRPASIRALDAGEVVLVGLP